MTITWTGTGGLFTRLGKIIKLIDAINLFRGTEALGMLGDIDQQFLTTQRIVRDNLYKEYESYLGAHTSYLQNLQTLAVKTMIEQVNDDAMLQAMDINLALVECLRQFESDNQSLSEPTVGIGGITYGASNGGNGVLVATLTDAVPQDRHYAFDEVIKFRCSSDVASGAQKYTEPFVGSGPVAVDPLAYDWEQGSSTAVTLNSIDPRQDVAGGQLLFNGDFENTTSFLAGWTVDGGLSGQDIVDGTTNAYLGSHCLAFTQFAGTPLSGVRQAFGSTAPSGSSYAILPITPYAFVIRAKRTAGLAGAGTLAISLTDSNGTVINDDAGNPNTVTKVLSTLTTSFTPISGIFRTPREMPTGEVRLRIKLTVPIADAGQSVYLDWATMSLMEQLYVGGPYIALYSGNEAWRFGDVIELDVSNDYAGLFVRGLERLYGLRAKGLYFRTTGAPTIPDSLTTA